MDQSPRFASRALGAYRHIPIVRQVVRERGAVMAEYGLLIAVVFLGVASAVAVFHDELIAFFSNAADTVANEGS